VIVDAALAAGAPAAQTLQPKESVRKTLSLPDRKGLSV